ncbi:hypothetical protein IKE_05692 [Bacillus cereus VD196]|uniref:Uncharacterized protein n=1 Tax=Bacillus cereus VD196 TaxID=1053243 RepID=A0A9W5V654_BACCE|nr:hypothetical protein [Bacillus cereus]EJR90894.1 hypothetical protein IKG_05853 [Bacillus cereus VD200]EOO62413.1 hypothetical protein IKE_05692 [Bacillus cereus VD196]
MKLLSKKIMSRLIVGALSMSVLTPSISAESTTSQKTKINLMEKAEANSTALMVEKSTGIKDVLNTLKI